MNQGKHFYIIAGAGMMLILVLTVAAFSGRICADKEEPKISAEQAKQIALEDAGEVPEDVTITKASLDRESEILVYEVDFYTDEKSYEYEINAQTGIVRQREAKVQQRNVVVVREVRENEEDVKVKIEPETQNVQAWIGVEAAQAAALQAAGLKSEQVSFLKSSLDTDDGRTVYEVEFTVDGRKYEFQIDAYQGTVVESEIELLEEETETSAQKAAGTPAGNTAGSSSEKQSSTGTYYDDDDDDRYDDDDDDRYDDDDDRYDNDDDRYDDDDDDRYDDDDDDRYDDDDDRDDDNDRDDNDDDDHDDDDRDDDDDD
ncbi:MAG: PepSY domain-containing protein [Lachnospiraceae bacterium]|nr:PepSY domain-containing protein [Lachnospiraceae bacterium]